MDTNDTQNSEERLAAPAGSAFPEYWQLTDQWIAATRKRYERFTSSDLTQVFMRGPFAGWSERELKQLADKLHENNTKWPRWPNVAISHSGPSAGTVKHNEETEKI